MIYVNNSIVKNTYAVLSSTTTTTSTSFVTLLTATVTRLESSSLIRNTVVRASFCVTASSSGQSYYRVLLDGNQLPDQTTIHHSASRTMTGSLLTSNFSFSAAYLTSTYQLQWRTSGAFTLSITPATNNQHATLLIQELSPEYFSPTGFNTMI